MKENGIKVAHETVEEGNKNLEKELAAPKSSKGKMQQAQLMISMGLERKRSLKRKSKSLRLKRQMSQRGCNLFYYFTSFVLVHCV